MYGCESWTIKKAEHQRIDAFQLWCWRRLLRVPWTPRRSNQSILKEISPDYSEWTLEELNIERTDAEAEAPIFDHLMWRANSFKKTLMLGKIKGKKEKGVAEDELVRWHHWLNGQEFEQTPGDSEGQGSLECCSPWGCKESDMTEWLNKRVKLKWTHHKKEIVIMWHDRGIS